MNKFSNIYNLEERTAIFGENVINLCKKVRKDIITIPIVNQLIRSGTSIGANYCEANGASSRKDFKNKIFICKKESKETKYWLRMMANTDGGLIVECRELWKEAQEFTKMFSKIAAHTN